MLQWRPPAEHILSNSFRFPRLGRRLRELCFGFALAAASGCAGSYALQPQTQALAATPAITWHAPSLANDLATLARWRSAVGSPLVIHGDAATPRSGSDAVTIVSWNVALDAGDVVRLVRDLQRSDASRPIVLLLQEAFRSGDDVPSSPVDALYAGSLGRSQDEREVDAVARALGFSAYYVPSMRNGAPGGHDEDRGNAILANVPLDDLTAIELPFERQRRVAVAARVRGTTRDGRPWSLRLASVHLDNLAGASRAWIGGEFARVRQARGLREVFRGAEPTVLAGDFNTWFGFADRAYVETAREYPQTRVTDPRRTFRGLLRLDHVFYRLPESWTADVRRAESSVGSDHYPLITTITF